MEGTPAGLMTEGKADAVRSGVPKNTGLGQLSLSYPETLHSHLILILLHCKLGSSPSVVVNVVNV